MTVALLEWVTRQRSSRLGDVCQSVLAEAVLMCNLPWKGDARKREALRSGSTHERHAASSPCAQRQAASHAVLEDGTPCRITLWSFAPDK